MADINVNGRIKVKTLKEAFKKEFGCGIRVYKGKKFADDDATLASIRSGETKGGDFAVKGNMKVGNAEKKFKEEFGISIQVEDKAGKLADNNMTLTAAGK
jgi:hypothetical protein